MRCWRFAGPPGLLRTLVPGRELNIKMTDAHFLDHDAGDSYTVGLRWSGKIWL